MVRNTFLCILMVLVVALATAAYAGKVELTTYYPAPVGEYKNLSTTENAQFATTSGNVTVGSASNPAELVINNTLRLASVAGNATVQAGGDEGSLRYSTDAGGTGVGGFLYRNSGGWVFLGGGGGGCYTAYSSAGVPATCLAGFTNEGSLGLYGACDAAETYFSPPGGSCHIGCTKITDGEAYLCCRS